MGVIRHHINHLDQPRQILACRFHFRYDQGDMDTIIDGYNLIFRLGWQGKARNSLALEKSRDRLIRELKKRIEPSDRKRITIVFDAKNSPIKETASDTVVDGFRVVFAQDHDEADSLIEEMIRQHSAPRNLTVVSSDLRLQTAAQRRKAVAVDSEQWFDRLNSSNPPERLSESELQKNTQGLEDVDWAAEFGIEVDTPQDLGFPDQDDPQGF